MLQFHASCKLETFHVALFLSGNINFSFEKQSIMGALLIKTDAKSDKLLKELAAKLGRDVISIDDDQFEDIALGNLMDEVKTGEDVSRSDLMKKLSGV
ncbi:MAG: hypothetical protein AAGC88_01970 [Bacteroidota bacterium]